MADSVIIGTFKDKQGWLTIDFTAEPVDGSVKIIRFSIWGRNLEIVLQKHATLRVHVNPIAGSFDKWESPIGNTEYMWIGSPLEQQAPRGSDPYVEELLSTVPPAKSEEEESEDDSIPAAKRQETNSQTAGTASAKQQDAEEDTPPKAGGSRGV